MVKPVEITVEYCSSCGYHAKADDLRKALDNAYGVKVDVEVKSGRATSFEIVAEDPKSKQSTLIHSKLETKKWPKTADVVARVGELLGGMDESATAAHRELAESEKAREMAEAQVDPAKVAAYVDEQIAANPVMLFSKTYCGYCKRVRNALAERNVVAAEVELDERLDGAVVQDVLATKTGLKTVPNLFVDGKHVGGWSAVEALIKDGKFDGLVGKHAGAAPAKANGAGGSSAEGHVRDHSYDDAIRRDAGAKLGGTDGAGASIGADIPKMLYDVEMLDLERGLPTGVEAVGASPFKQKLVGRDAEKLYEKNTAMRRPVFLKFPLFWFPYNVDQNKSRCISSMASVLAFVCGGAFRQAWAPYITAFMFADYLLRFFFGGRASVIGALTYSYSFYLPVRQYPGPPKQFAQFLGCVFSGVATLFYWLNHGDLDTNQIVGAVMMFGLGGAAFLDGFVGFCMGCFMFKILSRFGVFGADPSARCDEIAEEFTAQAEWNRQRVADEGPTKVIKYLDLEDKHNLPFAYKVKTDDQRKEDWHPIKHITLMYYCLPTAMVGIAAVWKFATVSPVLAMADTYWQVLTIMAVALWGIVVLLLAAQAMLYPRKFEKQLHNPVIANCAAGFALCIGVFAINVADYWDDQSFVRTIFWIAGIGMMLTTMYVMARWVAVMTNRAFMGPIVMIAPVGNFVIAAAAPLVNNDGDYLEVGFLWFGAGLFFWIILATLGLQRVMLGTSVAAPERASFCALIAAPGIAAVAWTLLTQPPSGWPAGQTFYQVDPVFLILYFISLVFVLISFALTLFAYFGRNKFDIGYFSFAFPLEVFAIASIFYNAMHDTAWTHVVAVGSMSAASYLMVILLCHVISSLTTRTQLFVPEARRGPGVIGKMMHYAFRHALDRMEKLSKRAHKPESLAELAELWTEYVIAHDAHADFEDNILFPAFDQFFPGIAAEATHQHEVGDALMHELSALLDVAAPQVKRKVYKAAYLPLDGLPRGSGSDMSEAQVERLQDLVVRIKAFDNAHFDYEEQHMQAIGRKYFNFKLGKDVWRKVFDRTAPNKWRVMLPFFLTNQFVHERRNLLLKGLQAVVPHKFQLIGKMVYEGVDDLLWDRLSVDHPDMIPRGVPAHARYY